MVMNSTQQLPCASLIHELSEYRWSLCGSYDASILDKAVNVYKATSPSYYNTSTLKKKKENLIEHGIPDILALFFSI